MSLKQTNGLWVLSLALVLGFCAAALAQEKDSAKPQSNKLSLTGGSPRHKLVSDDGFCSSSSPPPCTSSNQCSPGQPTCTINLTETPASPFVGYDPNLHPKVMSPQFFCVAPTKSITFKSPGGSLVGYIVSFGSNTPLTQPGPVVGAPGASTVVQIDPGAVNNCYKFSIAVCSPASGGKCHSIDPGVIIGGSD